jgi:hypothetical protein
LGLHLHNNTQFGSENFSFLIFTAMTHSFSLDYSAQQLMPLRAYTSHVKLKNPSGAQKTLGMVIIRVQHLPTSEQSCGFQCVAATPTNDTWSISMNDTVSQRSIAQAMQQTDDTVQVMELWSEHISEADKHSFSRELHNAMQKRSTITDSSVVTHNFALLAANASYQGFRWVCSFLLDKVGNVSRITASLCAL